VCDRWFRANRDKDRIGRFSFYCPVNTDVSVRHVMKTNRDHGFRQKEEGFSLHTVSDLSRQVRHVAGNVAARVQGRALKDRIELEAA